ncbi:hypothetical protein vseg_018285 [Gypsophila vaccaria]
MISNLFCILCKSYNNFDSNPLFSNHVDLYNKNNFFLKTSKHAGQARAEQGGSRTRSARHWVVPRFTKTGMTRHWDARARPSPITGSQLQLELAIGSVGSGSGRVWSGRVISGRVIIGS